MLHPVDLKYIEQMIPNMSEEVLTKLKSLQSGTCVTFGSSFKIPIILSFELPNPTPNSNNCDISKTWFIN